MLGDSILGDVDGDEAKPIVVGPRVADLIDVSLQLSDPSHLSSQIADSQVSTVDGLNIQALSTKPTAPKFSLGRRHPPNASQKSRNYVPGPGSYITSDRDGSSQNAKVISFGFGTTTRLQKGATTTPGPGAYSPTSVTRKGSSGAGAISITPRRKTPTMIGYGVKAPGPGAHILPDLTGQVPRGKIPVTITPRRHVYDELATSVDTPGPGEYEHSGFGQKVKKSAPSKYGFGSARQRPREQAEMQPPRPGPGSYLR